MINPTNEVLVSLSGSTLDKAIRVALRRAANAIVAAYNLEHIDLETVTTKTNKVIAFSKFVHLGVLKSATQLNEDYILNAFKICQALDVGRLEFEKFMVILADPKLCYNRTYVRPVRTGLGLFLISLHTAGAITLPMSFKWPGTRTSDSSGLATRIVCENSEILSFIRSVETVPGRPQDPVFGILRGNQKRIEWFSTYATRVLLACGWNLPEEASLDDLTDVYQAQAEVGQRGLKGVGVFGTLIEVLVAKFGSRLRPEFHDPTDWRRRMVNVRTSKRVKAMAARGYGLSQLGADVSFDETIGLPISGLRYGDATLPPDEHFSRLARCSPAMAHPDRLQSALENARGNFDFKANLTYWIEVQGAFLRQKRENAKGVRAALGYLNLYLFYYLPYWYLRSSTSIPFPATPDKLVGSVFVSRLLESDEPLPRTLVNFLEERAKHLNWDTNSHYAALKHIEVFFDFIIKNNHKLKDSKLFVQPLSSEDYPLTYRSLGTNKVPLPRRLLSIFISYLEAFRAYVQFVADRRIEGEVTDAQVQELTRFNKYVDTKSNADSIGYVPIVFVNGKTVPLWWLPGFPKVEWMQLKNGVVAALPHPHSLNQIAVAVYTGLRHNHIQWLDAKKFDSYAGLLDGEYTRLFVNTDKVKKAPWLPEVNVRVINILRDQLRWRNAIDAHGFDVPQFYNNNPLTAYPKFLPLFAYGVDGTPHPDAAYSVMWQDAILGFQTFLQENFPLIGGAIPTLAKLRPVGVDFHDNDIQGKYRAFSNIESDKVILRIVTEITPHSARVSVVSELIRFLPAALIGQQITGQTEGTVYHYVVADMDELRKDQTHQALHLRELARKQQLGLISGVALGSGGNPYLKADDVNSNLAKSLKVNMTETFSRYGCISLSVGEMETGVEVLEQIGLGNAAFNKTEICPYGNHCPPALIKELRGIRRCGVCPYAVRSIDHLPAICAKQKQSAEVLSELDRRITHAIDNASLTPAEVDALEEERQRNGEELAGWELCIEVLEQARQRIAAGEDSRRWVVERPEILIERLHQVSSRSDAADYLLSRLAECTSYPGFQSPQISKRFDLLRRRILAKAGAALDDVLSLGDSVDSAAECAGLIRSLAAAHRLTTEDIDTLLTTDAHLSQVSGRAVLRIANG